MKVLFHVKGMEVKHLTWLKKSEPTEAWEIEDEEKMGDTLSWRARYVRSAILLPTAPKQFPSFIMARALKRKNAKLIDQIDRYERAKKRAEKKIEQISDELLRDTAIHQVLNFCMKARDVENAEGLFHQIQTARITELVKSEHPMFRDSFGLKPGK